MRLSIFTKIFLALFLSLLTLLAVAMASVQWSFRHGFDEYLERVESERLERLVELLESRYAESGDWRFLRDDQEAWFALLRQAGGRAGMPEPPPGPGPDGGHGPPPPIGPAPLNPLLPVLPGGPGAAAEPVLPRFAPPHRHRPHPYLLRRGHLRVLDADRRQVVGPPFPPPADAREVLRPLHAGSVIVGWLGFAPPPELADELEAAFIEEHTRSIIIILGLALVLALGVSLALARLFLGPVRRLAMGARALAAGRYDVEIPVGSADELGRLADDFNLLARTLQRNEEARRQWVADTSHELRTPLAILRSELEALLDGVRQPTPERLRSLHAELLALGKLVDDLHELSVYDLGAMTYRLEKLDLAALARDLVEAFQPRFDAAGLRLDFAAVSGLRLEVIGDAIRLRQLLANLLENSLRHTEKGGVCRVQLQEADGAIVVVEDSAPGVPNEALERLFERFFRVDPSRSRAHGGAGLGLAICHSIAAAHGGSLSASHSELGGLRIRLRLPAGAG